MEWLDDLTAKLPARRDDEPSALRDQIVRELRDHLQCAFQREMLKCGNEIEAAHRVLARFGDPARLARILWFDAMSEKIMSQRLMLGFAGVMAAGCISMGFVSWRVSEQSAQAMQSMAEEGRAMNVALLEQFERMRTESEHDRSLDWIRVKVRLVQEKTATTPTPVPASGLKVHIDDGVGNRTVTFEQERLSTAAPEIDFGLFAPGRYRLTVSAPCGDFLRQDLFVRAGESPVVKTIVCPTEPVEGDVAIDVEWPDDLLNKPIGLFCFVYSNEQQINGEKWLTGNYAKAKSVLVTATGELIQGGNGYVDASEGAKLAVLHDPRLPNAVIPFRGREIKFEVAGAVLMDYLTSETAENGTEWKSWPMIRLAEREPNRASPAATKIEVRPANLLLKEGVNRWTVKPAEAHFDAIRAEIRKRSEPKHE